MRFIVQIFSTNLAQQKSRLWDLLRDMLLAKPQREKWGRNVGAYMTIMTIGLLGVLLCTPALATTMAASPEATGQCCAPLNLWTIGLVNWMQETH